MTFDEQFLRMALLVSEKAKDRTKTGTVIVGPENEVRTTGYNGIPRGVEDYPDRYSMEHTRSMWVEHGERNAIFNAARIGTPLAGCTAYIIGHPCADCARALVQVGVQRVVLYNIEISRNPEKHGPTRAIARMIFDEADVIVTLVDPETPRETLP